jgi:hypothetical protein
MFGGQKEVTEVEKVKVRYRPVQKGSLPLSSGRCDGSALRLYLTCRKESTDGGGGGIETGADKLFFGFFSLFFKSLPCSLSKSGLVGIGDFHRKSVVRYEGETEGGVRQRKSPARRVERVGMV